MKWTRLVYPAEERFIKMTKELKSLKQSKTNIDLVYFYNKYGEYYRCEAYLNDKKDLIEKYNNSL